MILSNWGAGGGGGNLSIVFGGVDPKLGGVWVKPIEGANGFAGLFNLKVLVF